MDSGGDSPVCTSWVAQAIEVRAALDETSVTGWSDGAAANRRSRRPHTQAE
ncbi:hypothetical protein [Halalkalicoccus salilacus]|uniref:hypothetical protein n=1 Tax=Halalkalicoccus sp. GCM10025704 TaxID=3252662 RepID=UPI00360FD83A